MKERPILFNSEMVRAVLDGRKTQTRRVVKPLPSEFMGSPHHMGFFGGHSGVGAYFYEEEYPEEGSFFWKCPYGKPGDRLWVRETWAHFKGETFYRAEGSNNGRIEETVGWKPSIHMFRRDSRILLEVVSVRVERVQDISEDDARAEAPPDVVDGQIYPTIADWHPQDAFEHLWDSINDKRGFGWDTNCWVWVVEFKRVEG